MKVEFLADSPRAGDPFVGYLLPEVGDVLVAEWGVRVVVVTEPVEITEADTIEGWRLHVDAPFRCAAREAQDSPSHMPEEWCGCIALPGAWRVVGREA